jgi:hypothetical protein
MKENALQSSVRITEGKKSSGYTNQSRAVESRVTYVTSKVSKSLPLVLLVYQFEDHTTSISCLDFMLSRVFKKQGYATAEGAIKCTGISVFK